MKLPFISRFTLALGFITLAATASLRADFIQPVTVQASSDTQNNKDTLINGMGWVSDTNAPVGSPFSVHSADLGQMWFTVGSSKQSLTFDLGSSVSLNKVYVWSLNAFPSGSMKDAEVWVSPETDINTATNFDAIATISLFDTNITGQAFDVVGTGVRLVKLKSLSNYGNGFLVGLAEARFGNGVIAGNMPWVVLNSPRDGDEVSHGTNATGADITVNATVTDVDGASDIQMVQFFDGATLVTNRTAPPYTVVLPGVTNGPHTLRVVATDQSGKLAWQEANVFVRTLYADRVIKIDDNAGIGTGVNQLQYSGAWSLAQGGADDPRYKNNDHYNNGNTDEYFEVRFRGVKIDVYSTVASHHGPGAASIDGGPETAVDYYAAQRGEQVFVYGSPVLANGEHVLKIRVAGTTVVTADRFDVQVFDLAATKITKVNDTITIELTTPNPDGQHQLLASTDLMTDSTTWLPVPSAVATKTGDHTIRITLNGVTGAAAFYRVVLLP
jgi:hypothetical protein